MFNIKGLIRKLTGPKLQWGRKSDSISWEAACQYLHVLVQTKPPRRDAVPYLETL